MREIPLHQRDALRRRAVAGMREQGPHQRDTEPRRDEGQHQDVDVGLADLPIGSVKTKMPRARIAEQRDNNAHGPILEQAHVLKEALQTAISRRNQGATGPLTCDMRQVHRPGADHAQQDHAERLEP